MKRIAFLEYVNTTIAGKLSITLEVLLLFTSNVMSTYKLTKDSGTGFMMLFLFKMMVPNDVKFFNVGKMVPNKPNFP
jgi:hypothetical protein